MILATRFGNRELRSGTIGSSSIVRPTARVYAHAGVYVNAEKVFGLPAASSAIRLVAEIVAALPLRTFRGHQAAKQRLDDVWQARLLEQPNSEQSDFDFWSDVNAAIEGFGNAFAQKVKDGGRVVELIPLHPECVWVRRDPKTKEKVYRVRMDGRDVDLPASEVLHFRGFCYGGGCAAPSPVQVHRHPLGLALAIDEFQGRYFANDTRPGLIFKFPQGVSREAARDFLDGWNADHQGLENQHRPGAIGGGADVVTLPVSLEDAQFIDSQKFSVEQVARIFRVPAELLDSTDQGETLANAEQRALRFLAFFLAPRLRRLERALRNDVDLFAGGDLYPEFDRAELLRADAKTQAEIDHRRVQSGVLLRDEIRAEQGRGPLPDGAGQVPQLTPVGGAPNPDPLPS